MVKALLQKQSQKTARIVMDGDILRTLVQLVVVEGLLTILKHVPHAMALLIELKN